MRIFLLILSVSLVLTSCSSKSSSPTQWEKTVVKWNYNDVLENTSTKIKNTPEFEECMRPSVNMCVNQVGNQLARSQKSIDFCDEMMQWSGRDGCKFGVIMSQVAESKDIKQCDTLADTYKKECRISILLAQAVSANDLKKCDLIDAETAESGSTDRSNSRADQCRADLIMRKQWAKPADCDILKNGVSKDMCKAIVENRNEWAKATTRSTVQN